MWIAVAFVAPVLWAVSTHIDKYPVDRYFSTTDVGPLLVFTGIINLPLLGGIAALDASASRFRSRVSWSSRSRAHCIWLQCMSTFAGTGCAGGSSR